MTAFTTGLSGLNAAQKNLEVVSNNVANVNSKGFKRSRAEFGDFYSASFTNFARDRVGIGTKLNEVRQEFSQGALTPTNNPLDLAISGEGFFKMTTALGEELYTRNGQFGLNKDGFIVNNQGFFVTGYPIDETTGMLAPEPIPIQIDENPIQPNATTAASLRYNLESTAEVPAVAFDPADPTSYNSATSLSVFDQQGNEHSLSVYFIKTDNNAWEYRAIYDGDTEVGTGSLEFNAQGLPADPDAFAFDLTIPDTDGTTFSETGSIRLNLATATQQGVGFSVSTIQQDGFTASPYIGPTVEEDGVVTLNYANGQKREIAKIGMFKFTNDQGLKPAGNNAWEYTNEAGTIFLSKNNDTAFGLIQGGFVEEANVDLTAELVEMISAQRAYQANSQSIRTQDAIIQTATNLRN